MKKLGYRYKTYWCESEECYFRINASDKFARDSSQLEAIHDNDRDIQYPTYNCGDIDTENYLNEEEEIDFYLLKKDSNYE
jgi:hypothetical protein